METLRRHVGGHAGAATGHLCVTEISSLVMRAGRAGGFTVRTEIQIAGHTRTRPITGEMDCGWFCPITDRWIVAWEFDGRSVGEGHVAGTDDRLGNARKFAGADALLKIQALYSLRNNLTPWGRSQADRCRRLLGTSVRVVSDEELMAPGGIEQLVAEGRRLAGMPALQTAGH